MLAQKKKEFGIVFMLVSVAVAVGRVGSSSQSVRTVAGRQNEFVSF